VSCSSPLKVGTSSYLAVMTEKGMSVKHDEREEPFIMSPDEEDSELQELEESFNCAPMWHCGG
jgi:hypothetical protein